MGRKPKAFPNLGRVQSLADDGDVLPPEAIESGHTTIDVKVLVAGK